MLNALGLMLRWLSAMLRYISLLWNRSKDVVLRYAASPGRPFGRRNNSIRVIWLAQSSNFEPSFQMGVCWSQYSIRYGLAFLDTQMQRIVSLRNPYALREIHVAHIASISPRCRAFHRNLKFLYSCLTRCLRFKHLQGVSGRACR